MTIIAITMLILGLLVFSLVESKLLREVDGEIQRANNILKNRQQPSLFDGQ